MKIFMRSILVETQMNPRKTFLVLPKKNHKVLLKFKEFSIYCKTRSNKVIFCKCVFTNALRNFKSHHLASISINNYWFIGKQKVGNKQRSQTSKGAIRLLSLTEDPLPQFHF